MHGSPTSVATGLVVAAAVLLAATPAAATPAAAAPAAATPTLTRASIGNGGRQGTADSGSPSLSATGRFVAFSSEAPLVPGDTNGTWDVYLRDVQAGTTRRVSVSTGGAQGNATSGVFGPASVSGNGRYVAFESAATNLVPGDTNNVTDIFVRDTQRGTTVRASVPSAGGQGNNFSDEPAMSADGRYVAFESAASNLVPGDSNGVNDVFVRDLQRGGTRRVSVGAGGTQPNGLSDVPEISADGRYVAFESAARNLVPHDTNSANDVFVRDLTAGTTRRVSVSSSGVQGNDDSGVYGSPTLSADGGTVVFESAASNLVPGDTNGALDVFARDLRHGRTVRVSVTGTGHQAGDYSTVSGARCSVPMAGTSRSSPPPPTCVPGDTNSVTDVFVHDLQAGTTRRVSVAADGRQAKLYSDEPALSADGGMVAFESLAALVPGDTNRVDDVYVRSIG